MFHETDCRTEYSEHPVAARPWVVSGSRDKADRQLFGGFFELVLVLCLWSLVWSWLGLSSSLVLSLWSLKLLTNDYESEAAPMLGTPPANFPVTFLAGAYTANCSGE